MVDLGEFTVPTAGANLFRLYYGATGVSSVIASYSLHVSAVVWVPVDFSAGVVIPSAVNYNSSPQDTVVAYSYPPRGWTRQASVSALSLIVEDMNAQGRNGLPILPPIPSGAPSGPARIVALAGRIGDFRGQEPMEIRLDVRERFTYLR
jgi:hypothetical protein